MADLTSDDVSALVTGLEQARAGQLSLYGLLSLLRDLEPVPAQLEKARQKRSNGLAVNGILGKVLESEELLGSATTEVKRTLAEDLERALQVEGVTARERGRAISFVEVQLQAAAKDNSAQAAARRAKLKEKRCNLETSKTVPESKEVQRLESQLRKLKDEYADVAGTMEAWQAGKVKFKSNQQLQSTKRQYEDLKKQVTTLEGELEAALRRRRRPLETNGAWAASAGPASAAASQAAGASPTSKPATAPKSKNGALRQTGPAGPASVTDGSSPGEGRTSAAARPGHGTNNRAARGAGEDADALQGADPEDEFIEWSARRSARQAKQPITEQARAAQREAKQRGRQVLEALAAENYRTPATASSAAAAAVPPVQLGGVVAGAGGGWTSGSARPQVATKPASVVSSDGPQQSPPPDLPPPLPGGWEAVWSEEHGTHYYWNTETDHVQWDLPAGGIIPQAAEFVSAPAGSRSARQEPQPGSRGGVARQQASAADGPRSSRGAAAPAAAGKRVPQAAAASQSEVDEGPKLSFACVCAAVAAETGTPVAEVREMGMESVAEWRANFGVQEWERIRDRAIALESAKKELATWQEREREAKNLERMAQRDAAREAARNEASRAAPPTASFYLSGARGAGRAAPPSAKAAAGRAQPPKAKGTSGAGFAPPDRKKAAASQPKAEDLSAMAHKNRFARFATDSDDEDDND